jgi:hypothetical protein
MHLHGLLIRCRNVTGEKNEDGGIAYEFRWKERRTVLFEARVEVIEDTDEIFIHKLYNMHRLYRTDFDNASSWSKVMARRIAPKTVAAIIGALQKHHSWINDGTTVGLVACGKTFASRCNSTRLLRYYKSIGLSLLRRGRSQRCLTKLMEDGYRNNVGLRMEGTVGSVLEKCPQRWSDRCYRIDCIV